MIQIWERCKPLQLTSPVKNDHALFIWKSEPGLSFSKKLSSYQDTKIAKYFWVYYIIKFVYAYQVTPSLTWIEIFFFFLQIAFTLNCWLLSLLGCVTYNIERATTFAILVKYTKNFKPLKKNVSIPRTDEKKLHTREFQQKGIDGNMKCKLLQKRTARKTTECSKYLRHIAIKKDIFSELN